VESAKALRSGYGASDGQKHASTVKAMVAPGERPQEVYTPSVISDALISCWGGIELDPCWGPGSTVPAQHTYYVPPRVVLSATGKAKVVFKAEPGELDGLKAPWRDLTFVNPPYKHLEVWLKKAEHEAVDCGHEVAVLCPARAHRKWFRKHTRSADCIIDLDPVTFIGYASAFPVPLVMIYWGPRPASFAFAFAHLGEAR